MERCADCGLPIGERDASYYAPASQEDFGRSYHAACGDPLGIKAAILAERMACADIADQAAHNTADGEGEVYIAHQIRNLILSRNEPRGLSVAEPSSEASPQ